MDTSSAFASAFLGADEEATGTDVEEVHPATRAATTKEMDLDDMQRSGFEIRLCAACTGEFAERSERATLCGGGGPKTSMRNCRCAIRRAVECVARQLPEGVRNDAATFALFWGVFAGC